MMLLLKAIARLAEIALMAAIALIGIGVGLYCLNGLISIGSVRPDRLLHLPSVRDHLGRFLYQTAEPGSVAVLALLAGIAMLLIALLLVLGLLGTRRERLLVVDSDDDGDLLARPRAIAQLALGVTESTSGVTSSRRPRVRLRRNGRGGRLKILARRGPDPDAETVDRNVHERIDPLAESLHLTTNLRVRLQDPREAKERDR